ncbi:hypothetical protein NL676_039832 [Syzygium grande]|nr:hypothetical protein NL676_039832 [Syzygium grande]
MHRVDANLFGVGLAIVPDLSQHCDVEEEEGVDDLGDERLPSSTGSISGADGRSWYSLAENEPCFATSFIMLVFMATQREREERFDRGV